MQIAGYGEALLPVEVATPQPGHGEVRIAVHRAGVNYPDLLLIQGSYQARPDPPFGPGFEVAGKVSAIGDGVDGLEIGDRVMAYTAHGGYAEEVVTAEASVFPIPDAVSFSDAAVLAIAYGTAYHALTDRGSLGEGEVLVVLGASGGVGLAAVEMGKLLGATVIGCVGAEWKADIVREKGADHVVDYATDDVRARVLELTGGRGADVVYDPVGGDALDAALRYLAWRGRLLIIGFTSGRIPDIPANRLLLKGLSAVGVFWGQFAEREPDANAANLRWLLDRVASGGLRPAISRSYPLEEAPAALAALAAREAVGKLVLEVR